MKLSIKTQIIELIYEDEYSQITGDTTKRLVEIIRAIPIISNSPTGIIDGSKIPGLGNTFTQAHGVLNHMKHGTDFQIGNNSTYVGTVEDFFGK